MRVVWRTFLSLSTSIFCNFNGGNCWQIIFKLRPQNISGHGQTTCMQRSRLIVILKLAQERFLNTLSATDEKFNFSLLLCDFL